MTPPARISAAIEIMADIEARLSPFARDGVLCETLLSAASVARRL